MLIKALALLINIQYHKNIEYKGWPVVFATTGSSIVIDTNVKLCDCKAIR